MKLKSLTLSVASIAMLGLAGCGTSQTDRATSGAGIGAAAGGAAGALTGGSILGGALLGGAAGGAAGYLTDPDDVNLGKPLWRR
jgi:osmotically inducible lipoprotein OsmB